MERGGGNLQLWYAKDGQQKIGSSSIYTVGPFDGFALVVDTHGGRVRTSDIQTCLKLTNSRVAAFAAS